MVFNNVYELITPPAVLKKTWFVDYFDGDDLHTFWNKGTGTFAMEDAVDEGFSMTDTAAFLTMNFNNIRHYDPNDCVSVSVWRRVTSGTNHNISVGFAGTIDGANANRAQIEDRFGQTNKELWHADASTLTQTSTGVAADTTWRRYEIPTTSTNMKAIIDGILRVTATTTLPVAKMQPEVFVDATGEGRIRYFEAYNT